MYGISPERLGVFDRWRCPEVRLNPTNPLENPITEKRLLLIIAKTLSFFFINYVNNIVIRKTTPPCGQS